MRQHPNDNNQNILFPHLDDKGDFSGFEVRNKDFHGFFDGIPNTKDRLQCEKGLWQSERLVDDDSFILGESAIDMLSFQALFSPKNARYASTGGAWGKRTARAIISAINDFQGKHIFLAFDNDKAGKFYTDQAKELLSKLCKELNKEIKVLIPKNYIDWNAQLMAGEKERFCIK